MHELDDLDTVRRYVESSLSSTGIDVEIETISRARKNERTHL